MFLKKLSIINFKNLSQKELELSPKINCFVGENATGKTNLLDAIYYLSFTKSYFNHIDNQSIKHNEDFFMLKAEYERENKKEIIYAGLQKGKKKIIKRNSKKYKKFSEHIGIIPAVIIAPDDNKLILEGSEERRKFIDSIISQYNKKYLTNLIKYKRVLAQRNQLLKNFAEKQYFHKESLEIWDEQLIALGNEIFTVRNDFLSKFIKICQKHYSFISKEKEKIDLIYKSQLKNNNFQDLLKNSIQKDRVLQYTTVGIHKDDIIFKLDNYILKIIGSQGQQKSFILSIKLAQYEIIKNNLNLKPILLLDDIFDKLDATRVEQIVTLITAHNFGQIFITHTNLDRLENILDKVNSSYKILRI